jgi:alanyl-tRNA synthetase
VGGVRRIEAVTGNGALPQPPAGKKPKKSCPSAEGGSGGFASKIERMSEQQKKLEKEISQLRHKLATGRVSERVEAMHVSSEASP